MHHQNHADRPVGNPAGIVEHNRADDDIAERNPDEPGEDKQPVRTPGQGKNKSAEIAYERQMEIDQESVNRETAGVIGQPFHRLPDLVGDIGIENPDEVTADDLRGIYG